MAASAAISQWRRISINGEKRKHGKNSLRTGIMSGKQRGSVAAAWRAAGGNAGASNMARLRKSWRRRSAAVDGGGACRRWRTASCLASARRKKAKDNGVACSRQEK
jgi:hypothetical protein